jgi:hypothetical protein
MGKFNLDLYVCIGNQLIVTLHVTFILGFVIPHFGFQQNELHDVVRALANKCIYNHGLRMQNLYYKLSNCFSILTFYSHRTFAQNKIGSRRH